MTEQEAASQLGLDNTQSDYGLSKIGSKLNTLQQSKQNKLDRLTTQDTLLGMQDSDSLVTKNIPKGRSSTASQPYYDAVEIGHKGSSPLAAIKGNKWKLPQLQLVADTLGKSVDQITDQDMIDVGNQQQIQKLADLGRTEGEDRWVAPLIRGVEQANLTGNYVDENGNKVNIPLDVAITSRDSGRLGTYGRSLAEYGDVSGTNVTALHANDPKMNANYKPIEVNQEKVDEELSKLITSQSSNPIDALQAATVGLGADIGDLALDLLATKKKADDSKFTSWLKDKVNTVVKADSTGNSTLLDNRQQEIDKYVGYDRSESNEALAKAVDSWKKGNYVDSVMDVITTPSLLAEQIPNMALMFAPIPGARVGVAAKLTARAAKYADEAKAAMVAGDTVKAASLTSKASRATAEAVKRNTLALKTMNNVFKNAGFHVMSGTIANGVIEERVKNNGGENLSVAEYAGIIGSTYALMAVDKLALGKVLSLPEGKGALATAFQVSSKGDKAKLLAAIGDKTLAIGAAAGGEAAQEYAQTWGEILGKQLAIGDKEITDSAEWVKVFTDEKNRDEALGAMIVGGTIGGQFRGGIEGVDAISKLGAITKEKYNYKVGNQVDGNKPAMANTSEGRATIWESFDDPTFSVAQEPEIQDSYARPIAEYAGYLLGKAGLDEISKAGYGRSSEEGKNFGGVVQEAIDKMARVYGVTDPTEKTLLSGVVVGKIAEYMKTPGENEDIALARATVDKYIDEVAKLYPNDEQVAKVVQDHYSEKITEEIENAVEELKDSGVDTRGMKEIPLTQESLNKIRDILKRIHTYGSEPLNVFADSIEKGVKVYEKILGSEKTEDGKLPKLTAQDVRDQVALQGFIGKGSEYKAIPVHEQNLKVELQKPLAAQDESTELALRDFERFATSRAQKVMAIKDNTDIKAKEFIHPERMKKFAQYTLPETRKLLEVARKSLAIVEATKADELPPIQLAKLNKHKERLINSVKVLKESIADMENTVNLVNAGKYVEAFNKVLEAQPGGKVMADAMDTNGYLAKLASEENTRANKENNIPVDEYGMDSETNIDLGDTQPISNSNSQEEVKEVNYNKLQATLDSKIADGETIEEIKDWIYVGEQTTELKEELLAIASKAIEERDSKVEPTVEIEDTNVEPTEESAGNNTRRTKVDFVVDYLLAPTAKVGPKSEIMVETDTGEVKAYSALHTDERDGRSIADVNKGTGEEVIDLGAIAKDEFRKQYKEIAGKNIHTKALEEYVVATRLRKTDFTKSVRQRMLDISAALEATIVALKDNPYFVDELVDYDYGSKPDTVENVLVVNDLDPTVNVLKTSRGKLNLEDSELTAGKLQKELDVLDDELSKLRSDKKAISNKLEELKDQTKDIKGNLELLKKKDKDTAKYLRVLFDKARARFDTLIKLLTGVYSKYIARINDTQEELATVDIKIEEVTKEREIVKKELAKEQAKITILKEDTRTREKMKLSDAVLGMDKLAKGLVKASKRKVENSVAIMLGTVESVKDGLKTMLPGIVKNMEATALNNRLDEVVGMLDSTNKDSYSGQRANNNVLNQNVLDDKAIINVLKTVKVNGKSLEDILNSKDSTIQARIRKALDVASLVTFSKMQDIRSAPKSQLEDYVQNAFKSIVEVNGIVNQNILKTLIMQVKSGKLVAVAPYTENAGKALLDELGLSLDGITGQDRLDIEKSLGNIVVYRLVKTTDKGDGLTIKSANISRDPNRMDDKTTSLRLVTDTERNTVKTTNDASEGIVKVVDMTNVDKAEVDAMRRVGSTLQYAGVNKLEQIGLESVILKLGKLVRGANTLISDKVIEYLNKQNSSPWEFSYIMHKMADKFTTDGILDKKGFTEALINATIGKLEDVEKAAQAMSKESVIANYKADELDIERMVDTYEMVRDQKFYIPWDYTRSGRNMIAVSSFNPQNSKISRFLASMEGMKTTVDITNEDDVHFVQIAAAQATDIGDVDKALDKDAIAELNKELFTLKDGKLSYADKGFEEVVKDGSMNALVKWNKAKKKPMGTNELMHTLQLVDLLNKIESLEDGETKVDTTLVAEADGVTNGMAIMLMQMGFSEDIANHLARAGVYYTELHATQNHGEYKKGKDGKEGKDIYQAPIGGVEKALESNPEVKKAIDKITNGKWRNFMKNPVMVFIYGSGMKNIRKGIAQSLVTGNSYIDGGIANGQLEAIALLAGGADIESMVEYKRWSYETNSLVALSPTKIASKKEAGTLSHYATISQYYIDKLVKAIDNNIGDVFEASFKEQFNEVIEFRQALKTVEEMNYLVFKSELIKKLDGKNPMDVLPEVLDKAYKEVMADGVYYGADNASGGIQDYVKLGKSEQTGEASENQITVTVNYGEYQSSGKGKNIQMNRGLKELIANVGAVGVVTVHDIDGTIMVEGHKDDVLNIYDALMLGIDPESHQKQVESMNKAFTDINSRHSILGKAVQKLLRNLDKLDIAQVDNTTIEDLQRIFDYSYEEREAGLIPDVTKLLDVLNKVDAQRLAMNGKEVRVGQYQLSDRMVNGSDGTHTVIIEGVEGVWSDAKQPKQMEMVLNELNSALRLVGEKKAAVKEKDAKISENKKMVDDARGILNKLAKGTAKNSINSILKLIEEC